MVVHKYAVDEDQDMGSRRASRSGAPVAAQRKLEAYRLLVADVYELAGISRRTSEQLAQGVGQTAARWHLMSVLSESELSVAAAARRLGLARQSVQRVADGLVRDGHVRVRPDPADRRAPLLGLTGSGRVLMEELFVRSSEQRATAMARAGVSMADLTRARDTIRALAAVLEPSSEEVTAAGIRFGPGAPKRP